MTQKSLPLETLTQDKILFLDMYGVLWDSTKFYDGVLESLEALKKQGQKICIITNATVLKPDFIKTQETRGLILNRHYDDVITSGDVCRYALENGFFEKLTHKQEYQIFIVGALGTKLFENVPNHLTQDITKADCLYFSSVQTAQYPDASDISHFMPHLKYGIQHNLPAVCANPDLTFMRKTEQLPTQGSTGVAYQKMGGTVVYFGKPYPQIFKMAMDRMQSTPASSLMVGDTLETDILGGHDAGMETLLVTQTGITQALISQGETLPNLYDRKKIIPNYTTSRFLQKVICEHTNQKA